MRRKQKMGKLPSRAGEAAALNWGGGSRGGSEHTAQV